MRKGFKERPNTMRQPNGDSIKMLERLGNIPQGSRVLQVGTPLAWLIYVEFSPVHCYYIVVDKK